MMYVRLAPLFTLAWVVAAQNYPKLQWNLTGDFSFESNPNGPWQYGYYRDSSDSGTFAIFDQTVLEPGVFQGWKNSAPEEHTDGALWKNVGTFDNGGIKVGEISFEADGCTPVARWSAPDAGTYWINVTVGGETYGGNNHHAALAGVNINGQSQAALCSHVVTNTDEFMYFSNHTVNLQAGGIVEVYVGEEYGYGNTQVRFIVRKVLNPRVVRQKIGKNAMQNARPITTHKSGVFVLRAISEAMQMDSLMIRNQEPPSGFGRLLEIIGFIRLNRKDSKQNGDVAVWSGAVTHKHGHVQVYYEGRWFSDYAQDRVCPWTDPQGSTVQYYRFVGVGL